MTTHIRWSWFNPASGSSTTRSRNNLDDHQTDFPDPTEQSTATHTEAGSEGVDPPSEGSAEQEEKSPAEDTEEPPRVYPTRRCRFCWEDVEPTVEMPTASVPAFLQLRPRVVYVDEDPDLGELVKPCLCKGTRRYVHEGCLRAMRVGMARTRGANFERHYTQCDICHFKYRLERVWFARAVSSRINQMLLTIVTLFLVTFALGFAADPILNLYLEPYSTVQKKAYLSPNRIDLNLSKQLQRSPWAQHFAKGFASVGILSFANALTTITSPWQWWNLRNSFLQSGGRGGTTGRDRVANISWILILVGVVTALWKIYSLTHYFAAGYLLRMSDRVKNVNLDGDDDDIRDVRYQQTEESPKNK